MEKSIFRTLFALFFCCIIYESTGESGPGLHKTNNLHELETIRKSDNASCTILGINVEWTYNGESNEQFFDKSEGTPTINYDEDTELSIRVWKDTGSDCDFLVYKTGGGYTSPTKTGGASQLFDLTGKGEGTYGAIVGNQFMLFNLVEHQYTPCTILGINIEWTYNGESNEQFFDKSEGTPTINYDEDTELSIRVWKDTGSNCDFQVYKSGGGYTSPIKTGGASQLFDLTGKGEGTYGAIVGNQFMLFNLVEHQYTPCTILGINVEWTYNGESKEQFFDKSEGTPTINYDKDTQLSIRVWKDTGSNCEFQVYKTGGGYNSGIKTGGASQLFDLTGKGEGAYNAEVGEDQMSFSLQEHIPETSECREVFSFLTICSDAEIVETSETISFSGDITINTHLNYSGNLLVNKSEKTISGDGRIFMKNIPGYGQVDLLNGSFDLNISEELSSLIPSGVASAAQALNILNLPIEIHQLTFLQDGVMINGLIEFPEILNSVRAEINEISITESDGLDFTGRIEIDDLKLLSVLEVDELFFEFNTQENCFVGEGELDTKLIDIKGGFEIKQGGLNAIKLGIESNKKYFIGTTGLAISGIDGSVECIQDPPPKFGLTATFETALPSEFIAFDEVQLQYRLGHYMKGSGDFTLFDRPLANAYFEITPQKVEVGAHLNLYDILIAYIKAAIVHNAEGGMDFIGKFGGELQIPDGNGPEYALVEALLRRVLKDKNLELPISIGGTDNVIFNSELSGRAWLIRPGKKDFRFSYLLRFKNGKLKTDFAKGFRLYNDDVFIPDALTRRPLLFQNEPSEDSRLEGRSLIVASTQRSATNTITQEIQLSGGSETVYIRVKGESSLPSIELTDPHGNIVNGETSNSLLSYDYLTNEGELSAFIIIDFPSEGTYTLSAENCETCYVDVIGNEGEPTFSIHSIESSDNQVHIEWEAEDPYDNANISLFYDTDKENADGTLITSSISEDNSIKSYQWQPDSLAGNYYIYGLMKDSLGNQIIHYYHTPVQLISRLSAPRNLSFSLENDSLRLTWEKIESEEEPDYLILFDADSISNNSEYRYAGNASEYVITDLDFGNTYTFVVVALDQNGNTGNHSNSVSVELVSELVNNVPVIRSIEYPPIATVGVTWTATLDLFDADTEDVPFLELISAPANTVISGNSLTYTPITPGEKEFFVKVSDAFGAGDSIQFFVSAHNEEFLTPSLSTNKGSLGQYEELIEIRLRNPGAGDTEQEIHVHASSAPQNVISLFAQKSSGGEDLFIQNLQVSRQTDATKGQLKVIKTDTLVFQYDQVTYMVPFSGPNSAPENLMVSGLSVDENTSSVVVASLSAEDYDGDVLTFTTSRPDLFSVEENNLVLQAPINFEDQNQISFEISVSDGTDSMSSAFLLDINDLNDPPSEIVLSNNEIKEHGAPGEFVGELSTIDEDNGESFQYRIISGEELFSITGSSLSTKVSFDYESFSSHGIEVAVTDKDGAELTREFVINILNVLDVADEEEFIIYPNPVNQILNIRYSDFDSAVLMELNGRKIRRYDVPTFDVGALPAGVYMIKVINQQGEAKIRRFTKL